MMYSVEEIRQKAVPIARKYGVKRLGLFGSYAKDRQNEYSDIDFLINKGRIRGLFDYMGLVLDLEDEFGCHVDVVMDSIEDQDFIDRIKQDEVILYEEQR